MKIILIQLMFVVCGVWGVHCPCMAQDLPVDWQKCYLTIPLPQQTTPQKGEPFTLSPSTAIVYKNVELKQDAELLAAYLKDVSGMTLPLSNDAKAKGAIVISIDKSITNSEGYTLLISKSGIELKGATPQGVFYGMQTLRKAFFNSALQLPPVAIADAPRFSYRGMMLDCGRHFYSVEFIKKFIDIMALHNMNRFHWHLTDDQGWRIEIKKYPRLTEFGSIRKGTVVGYNSMVCDSVPYGGFYTQDEAREVVRYAAERHITIIPEIDMPGHMKAALACYPELGCTGGPYDVGTRWGVYLDVLCMGNEKTFTFCEDVLSELMDIFPSKIIHIGGDEAPKEKVIECPKCQKIMAKHNLNKDNWQGYFTNRIEKFVNSRGRSIMGWDEILDGDINPSATIHSWHSIDIGMRAAREGHDVVFSPTSHCYFDYTQTTNEAHHEPSNVNAQAGVNVEKVYSIEPCPEELPAEVAAHVLGVQANIWCEYIANSNHVEYMALPRMAALAEVQWCSQKKDYADFVRRLDTFRRIYDHYKFTYARHLWPSEMRSPWDDE